jgi:hypothetical protein
VKEKYEPNNSVRNNIGLVIALKKREEKDRPSIALNKSKDTTKYEGRAWT